MPYLEDPNHLIVYPAAKEVMENDLFLTYIGVRAHFGMTGRDLLEACLEAWQLDKEKEYKMILIREGEQTNIALDKNIKETGLRNGDPIQIVAA